MRLIDALSDRADKYEAGKLPAGPRGLLFKQLLPEAAPLLAVLRAVAQERGKSTSQVGLPAVCGLT